MVINEYLWKLQFISDGKYILSGFLNCSEDQLLIVKPEDVAVIDLKN